MVRRHKIQCRTMLLHTSFLIWRSPKRRVFCWRGRVRGCPQRDRHRQARQANFGSVRGRAGCGVARGVRGAANVRAMEMRVVRRPPPPPSPRRTRWTPPKNPPPEREKFCPVFWKNVENSPPAPSRRRIFNRQLLVKEGPGPHLNGFEQSG